MQLRAVNINDAWDLKTIAQTTFIDTYQQHNPPQLMQDYIAKHFSIEQLTQEIQNPNCQFYFAEKSGKVVGYTKLNYNDAQTEPNLSNSIEIERIYANKEFHGQGIGYFLMNEVKRIAQTNNYSFVWLAVWENNPKAIAFYERNGFYAFGNKVFMFADDPQNDIMMRFDV